MEETITGGITQCEKFSKLTSQSLQLIGLNFHTQLLGIGLPVVGCVCAWVTHTYKYKYICPGSSLLFLMMIASFAEVIHGLSFMVKKKKFGLIATPLRKDSWICQCSVFIFQASETLELHINAVAWVYAMESSFWDSISMQWMFPSSASISNTYQSLKTLKTCLYNLTTSKFPHNIVLLQNHVPAFNVCLLQ